MSGSEIYTEQERAWGVLYDRIQQIMRPLGQEDCRGTADYWLLDDNWGSPQHKLFVGNLQLLAPDVVYRLQNSLLDFPNWEIVVAIASKAKGLSWPDMGLIIRPSEIVDDLKRQYFPPEFEQLSYKGSRKAPISSWG